jgi:cell division protein FtsI/penicillin-binding protein 2
MSKGFASTHRIALLAGGLFLGFGVLGVRLVWLHVVDRDSLLRSIVKTRRQIIPERARRGDIFDSHGAILATSHSLLVVGVDPSSLRKPGDKLRETDERKWPQLAALLGVPLPELQKIFATKFRAPAVAEKPVAAAGSFALNFDLSPTAEEKKSAAADATSIASGDVDEIEADDAEEKNGVVEIKWAKLAENISESTFAEIEKLGIKGILGERVYRRAYPHHELASHVLGFVNHGQQAITGIERYADFYLRGQDGWREGERDGRRRELAQFSTREVPRADGYSVTLSIDANVQDVVEQELALIVQKYSPLKATIIVSDPRDGMILGLGNYPTFDPNAYNQIPKDEQAKMKNIAVADVYEPGSVFKIVAAAGALEEGLVTEHSVFDCSIEKIDYLGKTRSLPREDHHFTNLTVAEIIAHSSNRGAAQLAMRLGDQRFYNYARAFGFGQITGLPGAHEEAGLMAAPEKWDGLTITRMPMGQSVAVTPMQMHQAMSVIASGGSLLRPQLVSQISDSTGVPVFKFGAAEVRRVVSPRTAETMARLLMGVASKEGTAPEAAIAGYEVAGKTGTAQKYIEGKPSDRHHVASFVGFFPASRPQIVITVIVDDADARCPGGVAYGAKVAAPSFKHLGEQLIPLRNIQGGRSAVTPALLALGGSRP